MSIRQNKPPIISETEAQTILRFAKPEARRSAAMILRGGGVSVLEAHNFALGGLKDNADHWTDVSLLLDAMAVIVERSAR